MPQDPLGITPNATAKPETIRLDLPVTKAELNVILGALRMYQVGVLGSQLDPEKRADIFDERGRRKQKAAPEIVREIYYEVVRDGLPSATPDLDVDDIDALCARLNIQYAVEEPAGPRFVCSNCGKTGPLEDLRPLSNDALRYLANSFVGSPVPAGVCPACGTWCDEEKEGE
jgi:hypothetical protein